MKQQHYNFHHNSGQQNIPLTISHINLYHCDQKTEHVFNGHVYPKLLITNQGSGYITIDGALYLLTEKEVYFLNQDCQDLILSPKDTAFDLLVIGFNSNCIFSDENGNDHLIHYTISDADSLFYLKKLQEELEKKPPYYETACNHYINLFFIEMQRNNNIDCELPAINKPARDCKIIRDYIDKHFAENITLDTLATESNMNKYYLVHSFSNQYGCSPISYLNEKKIEESKKLLETSNYSIADIAKIIGFSSQSYFSQSFKKHTYMTPNEYRQSVK